MIDLHKVHIFVILVSIMKQKYSLLLILAGALLLCGVFWVYMRSNATMSNPSNDVVLEEPIVVDGDELEPASPPVQLEFDLGSYVPYSSTSLAQAQERGVTVLFFAATKWCHTCSDLEQEIIARAAEIPGDVTILKVDYDNDSAMKSAYGVTVQHTLIALDSSGEEITRWIGLDLDELLSSLEST